MKPIRVLSVQHYPTFGGPYNEIIELEPSLNRLGVETIVAMTDEPGTAYARLQGIVPCHAIPLHRIRRTWRPSVHGRLLLDFRRNIVSLRRIIQDSAVDLVKVHGPHNPQGAIAAALEGVPVVWVVSSTRVPKVFRRVGVCYVKRLASALLVNGRALIREYPGLGLLGDRVFPYYPPVNTERFSPRSPMERRTVRAELGVSADSFVVGTVANINPQKGIEIFVRMAGLVASKVPEARFVVVGAVHAAHQSYCDTVKKEAARLGLSADRLVFTGGRSDVHFLLGAMDVKVITSVPHSEGTTTTAGEAMACGVPVVTTDVGAVREVVEDQVTGFVEPPLCPEALARRVIQLYRDSQGRERMGAAGRQRVRERFSVEQCAYTHFQAYECALRRAGRSVPINREG